MAAFSPPTLKTALIVMMRASAPLVLYPDNAEALYEELKAVIRNAKPSAPKLIEKTANGPLKRVALLDTEITGVSLQVGMAPPAGL
ncbi:MAG: hypothetical protein IPK79_06080 [Vampirovibrionales bacterium]|nr:hypothetical protein [Vampirovibrionales bacterium]